MIPEGRLSTTAEYGQLLEANGSPYGPFFDWEMGGAALQDPTQGYLVQRWAMRVVDFRRVEIRAGIGSWQLVFEWASDITYASFAFDANMNVVVVFNSGTGSKVYWFDPTPNAYVFFDLPAGIRTPRTCLDEKRPALDNYRDTLVTYFRGGNLCIRSLSQRFLTETILASGQPSNAEILEFGMNVRQRVQWGLRNVTMPGHQSFGAVPLADVVNDLCFRAGLTPDEVDTRSLDGYWVDGLKVDNDDGLDKPIQQLRDVFMFDKSEHDKKIRFVKRGQGATFQIPYIDLVNGTPVALKRTITDETKLPRQVAINHLDPDGGFAKNKQTAQRRSNLVNAKGKRELDTQVVLSVDAAASVALTKLKLEWYEQNTYKFSTTVKYSSITTGDVGEVEDAGGTWHRVRIEERNEDGGVIEFEARQDAGPNVYGSFAQGIALRPPVSTSPGVIGETDIEVMNIPVQRDQDDEVGVYIAAKGNGSGWSGYSLMVSTDGGVSYGEAFTSDAPSVIGETETDLLEETSYEYQGAQLLDVHVNETLESVSYDQQLLGLNRAVIGDEVIQFRTATLLETGDGFYRYRLSGLVRGKFHTAPLQWPAGTRFVLLDESVIFARVQTSMVGQDLVYKPISFGLSSDETVATEFNYDEVVSQTEWKVGRLTAQRDPEGIIRVDWLGSARLGTDSAPRHSKYFGGYRVTFSNGFSIDTREETMTHAKASLDVEWVRVAALNQLTGPGPYVEAIPVDVPSIEITRVVIDGGEVAP